MTISSATSSNTYIGNDATYTFSFTFPITSKSHLVVTHIASDGTETVLVENTNYTVTWTGTGNAGSITRIRYVGITPENYPLATGESIRLERTVPIVQTTDIKNAATLRTNTIENIADYLVSIDQQQERKIGAALRIPASETATEALTVLPGARANTWLGFDNDKNPVALTSGPETLEPGVYHVDQFGAVGDGVTDDTAAVQAAIAAATSGSTVKFSGNKHYYLTSLGQIDKPLIIDGCGCALTVDPTSSGATGTPIFSFKGTLGTQYALNATTEGVWTITCTTASHAGNFAQGDYVLVESTDTVDKWDASGDCGVRKKEVTQVQSVNAGTGAITLIAPLSYSMTVAVIGKITMVVGPEVRNFARITEVNAGSAGPGGIGYNSPDIIAFTYCAGFRCSDVRVYGWGMNVCSSLFCFGGYKERLYGERAYYPATGGCSNLCKDLYSRDIHIEDCTVIDARHILDWSGCLDSGSSGCLAIGSGNSSISSYETHGWLSKRIYSTNDRSIGGQGWFIGNNVFAQDYAVTVTDYQYYSADGFTNTLAMIVWSKCEDVEINHATIFSDAAGIRITNGAKRVVVRNSNIRLRGSGVTEGLQVYDAGASGVYAQDITLQGNTVICGSDGFAIDCSACIGDLVIKDNYVSGGYPISCLENATSTVPDNLVIDNNTVVDPGSGNTGIQVGYASDIVPTGVYRITGNTIDGPLPGSIRVRAAYNLRIVGNRMPGSLSKIQLVASATVTDTDKYVMAANGAVIYDNDWTSDVFGSTDYVIVGGPSGKDYGLRTRVDGKSRWHIGQDSNAESGGNTGSSGRCTAYNDDGTSYANLYYASRSSGTVEFQFPSYYFRTSIAATDSVVGVDAASGQNAVFRYRRAGVGRWDVYLNTDTESGSDAGSGLSIAARTDAGAFLENIVKFQRAASSPIKIYRPVTSIINTQTASLVGCVFTSTADATVANSVIETTILGTGIGSKTLPANFWTVGKTVRIKACGRASSSGTPNLQIKTKIGSVVAADGTSLALVAALTNAEWQADITLTCRSVGVSGTVQSDMQFRYCNGRGMQVNGATNLATVDTTASASLDLTATWGTASASNTISGYNCTIEILDIVP